MIKKNWDIKLGMAAVDRIISKGYKEEEKYCHILSSFKNRLLNTLFVSFILGVSLKGRVIKNFTGVWKDRFKWTLLTSFGQVISPIFFLAVYDVSYLATKYLSAQHQERPS